MNAFRDAGSWLTFCFDERCTLTERAVYFGDLARAAGTLDNASRSPSRPIDIACAVFCAPIIGPADLKQIVCDVAALKLPRNLSRLLPTAQRTLWDPYQPEFGHGARNFQS